MPLMGRAVHILVMLTGMGAVVLVNGVHGGVSLFCNPQVAAGCGHLDP